MFVLIILRKLGAPMKKLVLGSLALVAFAAGPALAADISPGPAYPKAPALAPLYSWTGCLVGGHLGGAASLDTITGYTGISRSYGSAGFIGGGQVGCDYQFAPGWVVGAEGRAAWSSLKNTHAGAITSFVNGVTVPAQFTIRNDFLASATARLGYSFADSWLAYARVGAAWTREKVDDAFIDPVRLIAVDPNATAMRTGWTFGTGTEWAFAPQWSATLEYNYYDFGNKSLTLTDPVNRVNVIGVSLKDTIHSVTTGVNYRF
jgi:outer membrane immunogenic protein